MESALYSRVAAMIFSQKVCNSKKSCTFAARLTLKILQKWQSFNR